MTILAQSNAGRTSPDGLTLRVLVMCALLFSLLSAAAMAAERGTVIRKAVIYVAPDVGSAKLATTDRGREAVVLERTPGWVHVIATLMDAPYSPDPEATGERNVTGWILDKGYISDQTPKGDEILFGEAAASEDEASQSHGRKGAAADARRLYYRIFELFPKSPLAGEALYRAADIQWQLDKEDMQSRPSYKTMSPGDRQPIDEQAMRLVHKKFPGTKWADLAAFQMLENKMCGDWAGASKCPEKEADIYEKYANEHPASPKAAEAYYDAAYRWASVITIYSGEGQSSKAPEAQKRAEATALKVIDKNASPEWNAKAERLLYMVRNNVPVYGTSVE
jgi:tetratricopeptide (TPR) repeat protein